MPCTSSSTRTAGPAEDQSGNLQSRVYCPNYVFKEAATKLATCRGAERGHGRSPLGTFFCVTSVYDKRRTTMRLLSRVPTVVGTRPLHNLAGA